MAFKVKAVIDTDTGERVSILRTSEGGYVNGIYVEGEETTIKTLASVQQPTKQQIELFTGLERDKDIKTFYINKYVRTSSEFDEATADIIVRNTKKYRAMFLGDWEVFGYNVVVGVRIE